MPLCGVLHGGGLGAEHLPHHHHHRKHIVIAICPIQDTSQTGQIQIELGNWQAASGNSGAGGDVAVHLPNDNNQQYIVMFDGQTLNNGLTGQFPLANWQAAGGSSEMEDTFEAILANVTATSPASAAHITISAPSQTNSSASAVTSSVPSQTSSSASTVTASAPSQTSPAASSVTASAPSQSSSPLTHH